MQEKKYEWSISRLKWQEDAMSKCQEDIKELLLTSIILGLTLHSWLFIETHFNASVTVLNKTVNPKKKTFVTKLNTFIYTISFFFIK